MARDGVPRRHGVLPVPVETGAGVEYEKWNWPRALQEVSEEWEVRDLCITRGSGPRVVWLLDRRSLPTLFFGLQSNQKEQYA
jgi:hypothetical protein